MTPRLGQCVARIGFVIMVLCTVASASTQITYAEGSPDNTWGDNIVAMGIFPVLWLVIAIGGETNLTLMGILLVHAGGFLGLTVMAVGLAMAGAGAFVKEGAPRIGLCVALVGFLIAVICALKVVLLDMGIPRLSDPFGGWSADATMKCLALWLLGGFVGFNLVVVGLAKAAVLALTRRRLVEPVSSPNTFRELPLRQLRESTWPIMPRQGWYVAVVGWYIIVFCVGAGLLLMPDVGFDSVPLYLGGFVGSVVIVVGLVIAGVTAFAKGSGK